jgi:hypothetical protein
LEGIRVKHWVAENSVKMYDKRGRVLRVETTLNQPRRFKVYRATAPGQRRHWVPLRKGIADIPRRVTLAQATNARYLDALSVVGQPTPVSQVLDPVSQRRMINGRPYRPLRPISADESAVFARLLDGRALLDGIGRPTCGPSSVRRRPPIPLSSVDSRGASHASSACIAPTTSWRRSLTRAAIASRCAAIRS